MSAGYHFSVDDVFAELVRGDVDSGWWQFFDDAHARHGVTTDLYVFLAGDVDGQRRTLADVPVRTRDALAARPWLRLGPHGLDYPTPPHAQDDAAKAATLAELYAEIDRLVGRARRSAWLRLHYFSEPYEAAAQLVAEGTRALLLTDRDAVAYRLPPADRAALAATGHVDRAGLTLRRSHVRLELVEERGEPVERVIDRALSQHGYVSIFTHEPELARPDIRALALRCFAHLAARGVPPVY